MKLPGKRFEIAGNAIHILHDPEERLQSLLLLIASARHSLTLSMYMFHNDTSGTEVRDAVAAAARRGVGLLFCILFYLLLYFILYGVTMI